MNDPRLEELIALDALELLDRTEQKNLHRAIEHAPDGQALRRDFQEVAALLAYDAPPVAPPEELKQRVMGKLTARRASARVIPFPTWILPYAIAAGFMVLGVYEMNVVFHLNQQLNQTRVERDKLLRTNLLMELRLATLEAKDANYVSSRLMVAWDPKLQRGIISMQNLPAPPAGRAYQLWVLDPGAAAPVSAGLLTADSGSQGFVVKPVSTAGPGFAVSLEPSGGVTQPSGPILFAVAPGQ